MRLLTLILLFFCCTNIRLSAQTKEIAFKSHSGNMNFFKSTLNDGFFDMEDGGFGLPAPTAVKTYKLDSVFYVSDSVSVVVVREYERKSSQPVEKASFIGSRKDTLYGDVLLGRKHALDSIKTEIGKLGYYINSLNETVFIGYDNKKPKEKKKKQKEDAAAPFVTGNSPSNPMDSPMLLMLGAILALSLLGGWISWRLYQPKFQ